MITSSGKIISSRKEEKMKTKTLPIDREKMLELYEEIKDCDMVRRFCETLWPDEFKKKEEWEDITYRLKAKKIEHLGAEGTIQLTLEDGGQCVAYVTNDGTFKASHGCKIVARENYETYFRILRRKE